MRKILPPLLVAALMLAACGASAPDVANGDIELLQGREIWSQRCQSCHGATGSGGIGPSLLDVEKSLTEDAQRGFVATGKGRMPEFDQLLTPDEIAAVVRYTREVL